MAKKKKTAEPKWLTDAHKAALQAAGVDWKALLAKLGQTALLILLQLLGVPVPQPAQGTSKEGCEHHADCCEVLAAAVNTVEVAADCCCDCCDVYA